ncbi:unnamed protein product, partial [Penicillium nalgiovense]
IIARMMLSRRACYKCGTIGHYAEVCSSTERLCYNCKQPGHESSACPLPRTTESKRSLHINSRHCSLLTSSSQAVLQLPGPRPRPG